LNQHRNILSHAVTTAEVQVTIGTSAWPTWCRGARHAEY